MTPEDVLSTYSPGIERLSNRIRQVIREVLPDAEERAYQVWRGIGYVDKQAGYVCGLFPKDDCVEIAFEHGWDIPGFDDFFDRSGKQVRYVRVCEWDDQRMERLGDLIERARLVRS